MRQFLHVPMLKLPYRLRGLLTPCHNADEAYEPWWGETHCRYEKDEVNSDRGKVTAAPKYVLHRTDNVAYLR